MLSSYTLAANTLDPIMSSTMTAESMQETLANSALMRSLISSTVHVEYPLNAAHRAICAAPTVVFIFM